uniref:EGF-like domain-containing protein n=1 Tax=Syphacia muris TaxID=451379 RepID=A0A0N5B0C8_9BILA
MYRSDLGDRFSSAITSTGFDLEPLWFPREFKITCCLGGRPLPENPQFVRNWTEEVSDYIIDEAFQGDAIDNRPVEGNCRVFRGRYLLSAESFFHLSGLNWFNDDGVICKCPDVGRKQLLDKNCRALPPCQNRGNRSFSLKFRCICPEPYFGEYCEKYCDQGTRMKDPSGRDYCSCVPFYQGEECKEMVCLNGGTQGEQRCTCPPGFLGYHCEIDTNRTSTSSRYLKFDEQGNDLFTRDVSGTVFSLIMIIVLVVSMYLLMKHRMQVQNRFATIRRDELSRTAQNMTNRRTEFLTSEGVRILSLRAAPFIDGGPPPYIPSSARGILRGQELLPPLPSYEDATKLPPLTRPIVNESSNTEESSSQIQEPPEMNADVFVNERVDSDAQPTTSSSCSLVQDSLVTIGRQKIERSSATRRSI